MLEGPTHTRAPLNTADETPDRGWNPKRILDAINDMFTELYSGTQSLQLVVPIGGNAKVGATAGWVITGGTNIDHATLPAAQTNATLVIGIDGLQVGDIVTAFAVCGQVESAGGNVTLIASLRKLTNAAADNVDAEIATDNVGTLTADTILSAANLGATLGTPETVAADEKVYLLLTGTTAAATDIDITHAIITITRAR